MQSHAKVIQRFWSKIRPRLAVMQSHAKVIQRFW